jgi:hypothetical protein
VSLSLDREKGKLESENIKKSESFFVQRIEDATFDVKLTLKLPLL